MTTFIKHNWGILMVLFLSFWAIKPLFVSGFFPMHDDTQVARVFEMGKMLKDGMFPVRWVPDLGYGYGYPIFNFYAPLAYYIGGLFTLLGFDALISTKIMMGIGILLAGVFMYLLAREFWGKLGGVLSGLFYVYTPYHALDIYVRGDVAEFWAYAFVPLMFWGFYKVFKDPKWKWVIVASLGYAGVILSHNLTAMMVTPFLLIVILLNCYIAYRNKNLFTIYYLLFTIFLGLMISAFYWLPALLEMKYTNVLSQIGGGADFRDHFVCASQLWDSLWRFGGSTPGCIDGLSFKIGKLHILLALTIFFFGANHLFKKKHDKLFIIGFSILGLLFSIFLMLEISKPIWEGIYAMAFFQYPWRFLLLASFFSSLVSGAVIWFLQLAVSLRGGTTKQSLFKGIAALISFARNDKLARALMYLTFVFLIFSVIYFNSKLFQPQTIIPKTASDYTNEYALKWTASKISDEFLPLNFKKPKSEREIAKSPATVPQETIVQKISNTVSLGGIIFLSLGIIFIKDRKRLNL